MPHRVAMVRSVAARLGTAHTLREVADAALGAAHEYLNAATASLWLLTDDADAIELRYEYNAMPAAVARFQKVPLTESDLPGPHVIATGDACFIASRAERDELWPRLVGTPSKSEAMAVLPLSVDGSTLGVVSFGFPEADAFDDESRLALLTIADQCAIALDRARLHEAMTERAERNSVLAAISDVRREMDGDAVARHIVEACSGEVSDFCAIYFREGHLVRRVALASRAHPGLAERIVDHFPTPLAAAAPNAAAIRTGRAIEAEPRTPENAPSASPAREYADVMKSVRTGAGWVFPLVDHGEAFGSIAFLAADGDRMGDDAVDLAKRVSERAALLISSAAAFGEQQAALNALHEMVLPREVAPIPGVEAVARYVPMASTGAIGGDWWDALPLPTGDVAFAIGDVAGHGIPAASVMGQIRNALRMELVGGRSPAEALEALSAFVDWTHPDAHCTAIVGVLSRPTTLRWASAGHPPPLWVSAAGAVQVLQVEPAAPLGVRGESVGPYAEHSHTLEPGGTLLLYTDGLIEGRTRTIDDGVALLASLAEAGEADEPLEAFADRLLAGMVDRPEDDVCLLAIRTQ